jgi:hypothetical protein
MSSTVSVMRIYHVCDENGNRSLPVRGDDGKYHLPGKMVLADRDEFRAIFMDILPLLRAGADSVKILMTPLMRYVKRKCCDDPGHITNKGSFGEEIGEGLNEICSWLRNMAFARRIRNFTVLDPNETMLTGDDIVKDTMQIKKFWKEDPVHMTATGYKKLGKLILESLVDTNLTRANSKKEVANPAQPRVDWRRGDQAGSNRMTLLYIAATMVITGSVAAEADPVAAKSAAEVAGDGAESMAAAVAVEEASRTSPIRLINSVILCKY